MSAANIGSHNDVMRVCLPSTKSDHLKLGFGPELCLIFAHIPVMWP